MTLDETPPPQSQMPSWPPFPVAGMARPAVVLPTGDHSEGTAHEVDLPVPVWMDKIHAAPESDPNWPPMPTLRAVKPVLNGPVRRIEPRLAGRRTVSTTPVARQAAPVVLTNRPIGFNCPACSVVLVIREPEKYDGQAAPCPHCGVAILPPRVAHGNPFAAHPLPGSSGLPAAATSPRALPRPERHGKISWRDGQSR